MSERTALQVRAHCCPSSAKNSPIFTLSNPMEYGKEIMAAGLGLLVWFAHQQDDTYNMTKFGCVVRRQLKTR